MIRRSLAGLVSLLVVGCGSLNVIERADGSLMAYSDSYSQSGGFDAAVDDARDYCKKKGKKMVVVKEDSKYKGADPKTKAIIGAVSIAHSHRTGKGGYYDGSRPDDYHTIVDFKCE